jgi:hypothetical protein
MMNVQIKGKEMEIQQTIPFVISPPFFLFWFVMRAGAGAGEVTSGVEE